MTDDPATADEPRLGMVPAPEAPAGASDITRRWALAFPDGVRRFAGVAPHEGEAAWAVLSQLPPARWDGLLVEITLPVVLSDGAGPYLLDAEGRVTLALGAHPAVADARVAMGEASPGHRIGALRRVGETHVWEWMCDAVVAPADRVEALTSLDEASDEGALARWEHRERYRAAAGGDPS